MSNNFDLDQAMALNEAQLDHLVQAWRESLARKRQRHGDNFNEIKAMQDLVTRLIDNEPEAFLTLAVTAVNRLAKMPDYNPVPDDIAALDFDFDPEEDSDDDTDEA